MTTEEKSALCYLKRSAMGVVKTFKGRGEELTPSDRALVLFTLARVVKWLGPTLAQYAARVAREIEPCPDLDA